MTSRRRRHPWQPELLAPPAGSRPPDVFCPLCKAALEWSYTIVDSYAKGFERWTLWHATCACGLALEYDPGRHNDAADDDPQVT